MTIHNNGGWWGEEKNEGTLDGVEEKVVGGGGNGKTVEWNRQYYPIYMYDYMNGVNIHCIQPYKWKVVTHLCTRIKMCLQKLKIF